MKKSALLSFFPFGLLLFFALSQSKEIHSKLIGSSVNETAFCAHDEALHNWLLSDPAHQLKWDEFEKDLGKHMLALQNGSANHAPMMYTLPVVVHIVHDNGAENITDAQVLQGIQDLNDAFANAGYYDQGTGVDTEIQFCLAKRDPDGNATTGITRDQNVLTDMVMETEDIALKDLNRWEPTQYINIWLVRSITSLGSGPGVAGYAYFPTSHGQAEDGIVMEANFFGSSPGASGVQIHEMGHYLGLYHTFQGGCTNNDCLTDGDRVCDTPPDQSTAAVPCNASPNTCNTDTNSGFATDQNDLFINYMDYGDFDCWSAFTQGQTDRMQFSIDNIRQSLLDSEGCLDPCTSNITASFTASATTIDAGGTVNFFNSSLNATTYEWRIDGTPFSSATNPNYTFNSVGIFEVILYATNADPNCAATDTLAITVNCPTDANFQGTVFYPAVGQTLNFTNTSSGATNYEWLLNGVSQGTSTDLSYTFNISGNYTLCLDAAGPFCDDTQCVTMFVFDSPGECTGPFLKYLGEEGVSEESYTIVAAPDGNLLIGGRKGNASLLIMVSVDGETIWERTFDMTPGNDFAYRLLVDVDDNLLVVGRDVLNAVGETYYFKYDYQNDNIIWSKIFPGPTQHRFEGLLELPSNNYLMVGAQETGSNNSNNLLVEVDKFTGNLNWVKSYDAGGNTDVSHLAGISGSDIYVATNFRYGGGLDQIRPTLNKYDLNGNQIWTKVYYQDITGGARQYMYSVLVENDTLVGAGHGDTNGTNTNDFTAHIIKTDIDGNAVWAKDYSFAGNSSGMFAPILQPIPNGYILQGTHLWNNQRNIFIMRTDKNGNPIWARSIGGIQTENCRSLIIYNGLIYFSGWTAEYDPISDIIFGSLSLNGETSNIACQYITELDVIVNEVSNIYDGQHNASPVSIGDDLNDFNPILSPTTLPSSFFPDCECEEVSTDCQSTFVKTFGLPNSEEDGWTICESDNGGFFMAGGSGDQSLLVKIDPTGTVAWSREFDLCPQNDFIRDIRLDSDGMLVGCGYGLDGSNNGSNFFFRYDHLSNNFLWIKNTAVPSDNRHLTILEKSSGGNFLVFGQSAGCDEALALEVNRNTGNSLWSKGYALGNCQTFSKSIIADGSIFNTGRYNFAGGGTNKMRGGITRLDLSGNHIWSRLYLVPVNPDNARIYPNGLIEDNGSLISMSGGDNDGSSTSALNFHLYSTDLDGNIQWAKNMNVIGGDGENARHLVNLPDGYLMMGAFNSNTLGRQIFLVKTDKQGNIVWSRQYGGNADEEAFGLLANNGYIHFIGRTGNGASGEFFLARLTLDGETVEPCDQIMDLEVTSEDFINPYDGLHPLSTTNLNYPLINLSETSEEIQIEQNPLCESICEEICDNGIDDDDDGYVDCFDSECPCNTEVCSVSATDQNFATQLAWQSTQDLVAVNGTPIIANLDPQVDTIPEIVSIVSTFSASANLSPNLLIFKGDGSNAGNPAVLPIQSGYDIYSAVNPAIGDVDRNGVPELVMVSGDERVRVYTDYDANSNPPMQEWIVSTDFADDRNNKPYLADFNGDGIAEVYVGDDIFQFDFSQNPPTLTKVLSGGSSIGMNFYAFFQEANCSPVAVDILEPQHCNGDPDCNGLELVAGNVMYSVDLETNDGDGYEIKVQRDLNQLQSTDTYLDGYTSVADVNLDGILDVVVSGGRNNQNGVYVWNRGGGGVIAWFPHLPPLANPNRSGALACVANVFDDTQMGAAQDYPEIIVTSQGYLNCYNLNAEAMGQPEGAWWILNTTDLSGATGATVFDFNGDGTEEIIYRDEDNLRIMYGGNVPFPAGVDTERNWETFVCGSGTFEEHPVVADVDNDQQAEVVVTGYTFAGTNTPASDYRGRLRVFEADLLTGDPWMSARPIWNQFNYFVVNVNDDLTLPVEQQLHFLEFPDVGSGHRPLNKFVAQAPLFDEDYLPYLPVPDANLVVNGVTCDGDSLSVSITVCNEGNALLPSETPIAFYLADPTVTAVGLHHSVLLNAEILPDACESFVVNIPTANGIVHVVVNDDGSTPTPYNLGTDFPVTNIPECNYLNNPASIPFSYTPPQPPDLGPDISFCNNGVVDLDAGPGWDTYEWQDGFADQVYTAWEEGTYWVTVSDSCGTVFSDTIVISMDTSIQFDLGPDTLFCPGDTLTLNIPGFENYEWLPNYQIDCGDCPTVNVTPLVDTTYTLVATDANGCISVDSITIMIGGAVELQDSTQICQGDSILLFGNFETEAGDYMGTLPNLNGCDTLLTVTLEVLPLIESADTVQTCEGDSVLIFGNFESQPGNYTDTLEASMGCDTVMTITLEVLPLTQAIDTVQVCEGDSALIFGNFESQAGNYIDTLEANIGCDTVMTITLEVLPLIEAFDTLQICIGDSILLFGNFESQPGNYSGNLPSSIGCDTSLTVTLEVVPYITEMDTLQICQGDSAFIFGNWISQAGNYSDTLISPNNCDTLMTITLTVEPLPTATQSLQICPGDSILIFGNFENQPGQYTGLIPNVNGCDTLLTINLEIWPSIGLSVLVEDSCPDENTGSISVQTSNGTPPFQYAWSNGETSSSLSNLEAGTYMLTLTDANGCSSMADATVGTLLVSALAAGSTEVSCAGFSDGTIFISEFGTGSMFSLDGQFFTDDTLFTNLSAGTFTLYTQLPNGCSVEQEIIVQDPPQIFVNLPSDVTIELGDSVQLNAQTNVLDSLAYTWTPTDWLSCEDCPNPWAAPFETTLYSLLVSTLNGCSDEDEVQITVLRRQNIYAPNAFSPNGDGINDNFTLFAGAGVTQIRRLLIFDRWGELVFEETDFPPNNPELGWNGVFRDELMNPAVFAWFAEIEYVDGRVELIEGDLTLMR